MYHVYVNALFYPRKTIVQSFLLTKALTKYERPKMKRDAPPKCSPFLRKRLKKTEFLAVIYFYLRPFIFRQGFKLILKEIGFRFFPIFIIYQIYFTVRKQILSKKISNNYLAHRIQHSIPKQGIQLRNWLLDPLSKTNIFEFILVYIAARDASRDH